MWGFNLSLIDSKKNNSHPLKTKLEGINFANLISYTSSPFLQVCRGGPNKDPFCPLRIQTGSAGFELFKMCFEQLPDDFFQLILSVPCISLIFSSPSSHLQLKNSELEYCVQNLSLKYHMKEKEIWNRKNANYQYWEGKNIFLKQTNVNSWFHL